MNFAESDGCTKMARKLGFRGALCARIRDGNSCLSVSSIRVGNLEPPISRDDWEIERRTCNQEIAVFNGRIPTSV